MYTNVPAKASRFSFLWPWNRDEEDGDDGGVTDALFSPMRFIFGRALAEFVLRRTKEQNGIGGRIRGRRLLLG